MNCAGCDWGRDKVPTHMGVDTSKTSELRGNHAGICAMHSDMPHITAPQEPLAASGITCNP